MSGGLGITLPPDFLGEASLVTNGFSARYGQALSGLVNVVTRDPDATWKGGWPTRPIVQWAGRWIAGSTGGRAGGGPVAGGVGVVVAVDAAGRLDDDPVNAPAPQDPSDPRTARPFPLPHNSGEQWNGAAKLVVPITSRATVRVLGIHSEDQRLLFDPVYKYDPGFAPAQRLRGDLVSGHVQLKTDPGLASRSSWTPASADSCVSFSAGTLAGSVDYAIGAITGSRFHFVGEDIARSQSASPTRFRVSGGRRRASTRPGVCRRSFSAALRGETWPGTGSARRACSST